MFVLQQRYMYLAHARNPWKFSAVSQVKAKDAELAEVPLSGLKKVDTSTSGCEKVHYFERHFRVDTVDTSEILWSPVEVGS